MNANVYNIYIYSETLTWSVHAICDLFMFTVDHMSYCLPRIQITRGGDDVYRYIIIKNLLLKILFQ